MELDLCSSVVAKVIDREPRGVKPDRGEGFGLDRIEETELGLPEPAAAALTRASRVTGPFLKRSV